MNAQEVKADLMGDGSTVSSETMLSSAQDKQIKFLEEYAANATAAVLEALRNIKALESEVARLRSGNPTEAKETPTRDVQKIMRRRL